MGSLRRNGLSPPLKQPITKSYLMTATSANGPHRSLSYLHGNPQCIYGPVNRIRRTKCMASLVMESSASDPNRKGRKQAEAQMFYRRSKCLLRKSYEIAQKCDGVVVTLVINKGEKYYVYRSDTGKDLPPRFREVVSR